MFRELCTFCFSLFNTLASRHSFAGNFSVNISGTFGSRAWSNLRRNSSVLENQYFFLIILPHKLCNIGLWMLTEMFHRHYSEEESLSQNLCSSTCDHSCCHEFWRQEELLITTWRGQPSDWWWGGCRWGSPMWRVQSWWWNVMSLMRWDFY